MLKNLHIAGVGMMRQLRWIASLALTGITAQSHAMSEPIVFSSADLFGLEMEAAHFDSTDHRRYGKAIAFTLLERPKHRGYDFIMLMKTRYIAGCDGKWSAVIGNEVSRVPQKQLLSAQRAPVATKAEPIRVFPIEPGLEAIYEPLYREPVAKRIRGWCAKATGSQNDELPLVFTGNDIEYVLMKTIKESGQNVEGWIESVGTELISVADNSTDGEAKTERRLDKNSGKTMRQISSDCASSTMTITQIVKYGRDGSVLSKSERPNGMKPDSVVPGSVAEFINDLLCKVAGR